MTRVIPMPAIEVRVRIEKMNVMIRKKNIALSIGIASEMMIHHRTTMIYAKENTVSKVMPLEVPLKKF